MIKVYNVEGLNRENLINRMKELSKDFGNEVNYAGRLSDGGGEQFEVGEQRKRVDIYDNPGAPGIVVWGREDKKFLARLSEMMGVNLN